MKKKKTVGVKAEVVESIATTLNQGEALDIEFLKESNAIEGEYDFQALECAKEAWEFLLMHNELTLALVCGVHKLLMRNRDTLRQEEKGALRAIPVYISRKEALNPLLVKEQLEQWILNVNDLLTNGAKETDIFKERTVKEQHIAYEKIHPFVDGNGRTGRMFMNWTRLKLKLPLLIVHTGEEQQEYYTWFK